MIFEMPTPELRALPSAPGLERWDAPGHGKTNSDSPWNLNGGRLGIWEHREGPGDGQRDGISSDSHVLFLTKIERLGLMKSYDSKTV